MKPIRIALSGSGYKAPVHAGALLAVYDAGYEPVEYAGTSGGSIVAALAACGMHPHDMQQVVMTMDWSAFLRMELSSIVNGSYCSGDKLLAWLHDMTHDLKFGALGVDLTIMSSDINRQAPFKWSRSDTFDAPVALAARASASIPFVYAPVEYGGVWHQDGGMANNIPVMRLVQDDVPRLGIDLTVKTVALQGKPTLRELAQADLEIMLTSNESTQVMFGLTSGARIAFVETGYCNGLDAKMPTAMRERLFNDGYAAAKAQLVDR